MVSDHRFFSLTFSTPLDPITNPVRPSPSFQGENNMGGVKGNVLAKVGYRCVGLGACCAHHMSQVRITCEYLSVPSSSGHPHRQPTVTLPTFPCNHNKRPSGLKPQGLTQTLQTLSPFAVQSAASSALSCRIGAECGPRHRELQHLGRHSGLSLSLRPDPRPTPTSVQ